MRKKYFVVLRVMKNWRLEVGENWGKLKEWERDEKSILPLHLNFF